MHNDTIRSKAQTWRIVATGAALAASFATFGAVGTASAARSWSTTTKADALFRCLSNGCHAGGVGYVKTGDTPTVGTWKRTIYIYCKFDLAGSYRVAVQDKNWDGLWEVFKEDLTGNINDTPIPGCGQEL